MNCTNKVITIKIPNVYKNYIFIIFTTWLYPVLSRYNLFLINLVPEYAKPLKLYTKRYPVNKILHKIIPLTPHPTQKAGHISVLGTLVYSKISIFKLLFTYFQTHANITYFRSKFCVLLPSS